MTEPTRLDRAMAFILDVCERKIAEAKPAPPKACADCLDEGLMFYPHVNRGRTSWYVFRCHCGKDAGVGTFKQDKHGPELRGRRYWSEEIPRFNVFRFRDGRPMNREDVFNIDEALAYETAMLAAQELP
jgi:hypothetical protein